MVVLPRSPTISGEMSFLITIITSYVSRISSRTFVIIIPDRVAITVLLRAVSQNVSWLVASVTIPQVVEFVC